MNLRSLLLLSVLTTALCVSAAAQYDVYDNGPTTGTVDAWQINGGFIVSNSFYLQGGYGCHPYWECTINGVSFEVWLYPGDVIEWVELSITSSEFGGTTYLDQVVNLTASNCGWNQYGFTLCTETATFDDIHLDRGTYWLNLQNAVVNTEDPVYWDENSGPSMASQTSTGTIPSESFTILGERQCRYCGTVPEPGGVVLFGSTAIVLLGAVRRSLR